MLSEFEQKVGDFIKANELFGSADKILLAVSGGADSTALLYAMRALSNENVFDAKLLCAHINHQLRGAEADSDEDFVITQAAELKLAVTRKQVDVRGFAGRNKLSIETAARKLRIKNLLEIARANNCDCVATAHQKNDNAETILQRLTRGTGFRGLGGIWPMRVFNDGFKFVRPLLCVRRDEIIKYVEQRNLKWRQDHTNADCTYRRNYIRHRLLPVLQQDCSGSLVEQLSELSESARGFYKLVCSRADEVWQKVADCAGEKVTLDSKMLLAQSQPVMVELVRRSLTAVGCGERDLTQRHYEGILRLAEQNVSGRKIDLPGEFVVGAEYGNLIFSRPQKSEIRSQMSDVRSQMSEVRRQKTEVRSQKSEVRRQKTEVRSQMSEVRRQKTEVRSQMSEVRNQKTEVRSQMSEVRRQKTEVRSQMSDVRNQKTEVRCQKTEVRNQKSENRSQNSEDRSQKSDVRNLSSVLAVRHPVDCSLSSVVLEVPGQTKFDKNLIEATILEAEEEEFEKFKAEKTKFIERFDFDKIKPPLVVRLRKPGDRFVPLGLGEEKKVGKFLTAARVPQEVRQKLLIVADSEKIIWVWPIRIGEQAKVTSGTRKILQLQITDMPMQAK